MTLLDLWTDPLYRLTLLVALLQLGVLTAMMTAVIGTRVGVRRLERSRRRVSVEAAEPLVRFLGGDLSMEDASAALGRLPRWELVAVLEQYAANLTGPHLDAVTRLYHHLELRARALQWTRSWLWWRRMEAVRMLGAAPGGGPVQVLVRLLHDPHHAVRLAAARALGRAGDPTAVMPLMEHIKGTAVTSRAQLAEVLVELGPGAIPHLRALLRAGEGEVALQITLLEVLALQGDLDVGLDLHRLLRSSDPELREAALRCGALVHLDLSVNELRAALSDPVARVRAAAARAAGAVRHAGVVEDLERRLDDAVFEVRRDAAEALATVGEVGLRALERVAREGRSDDARDMAERVLSEDPLLRVVRGLARSRAPEAEMA